MLAIRFLCFALALSMSAAQEPQTYYRLMDPSTHLSVTSCRNIDMDIYGDPAGTCEEHGFTVSCYTCRYTMEFLVEEANTCDQAHTDCFFRSEDEECIGSSQCPYAEKKVLRGGIDNNYALFKK